MKNSETKKIWFFSLVIMAAGLLALYSATYENVRVTQQVFFDQLIFAGLAIVVMHVLSRVNYRMFYEIAYVVYGISVVFLVVVLFAGREALGATRWFNVGGFSFQPSELSKLAGILFLARYFSSRHPKLSFDRHSSLNSLGRDLIYPLVLILISFILIFKQPDLGSAILIFGIFLVMFYASGIDQKTFWIFFGVCLSCVPVGWHFLKSYQKDRLLVFLNPNVDPLGAGYTIIQSKIAVGSGQLWGKGWLAGTQNQLNFLPERHTDFIFSVIGEEWGFIGAIVLLFCYFVLIYQGLKIAQRTTDRFGYLLAMGVVAILSLQVFINMSMTMGLSPVVGITLPLVSYGRTSFMVFAALLGILLNLSQRRMT